MVDLPPPLRPDERAGAAVWAEGGVGGAAGEPGASQAWRAPADAMPSQVCGFPAQHQPSFGAF